MGSVWGAVCVACHMWCGVVWYDGTLCTFSYCLLPTVIVQIHIDVHAELSKA